MLTTLKMYTETELEEAFLEAKTRQRPLLIDFWSVHCKGCKKMELVTYQDPAVLDYLHDNYVLLKFETRSINKSFSSAYLSAAYLWSPAFYVYTAEGTIVRNTTGYLPPSQFIPELEIGKAMWLLRRGKAAEAEGLLTELSRNCLQPALEQEALYWAGVAAFFAAHRQVAALEPSWQLLTKKYPGSLWAERADVLDIVL